MNWILFLLMVSALLALDLGVFNRKAHSFSFKEAMSWSVFWIALSCLFGVFVYYHYGPELGAQWFTAYVLEKSLSVDNLFVISLIFTFFATPSKIQHRCLFWGILGAIVFRGIFILGGVAIVDKFEWILYLFGAFLMYSGVKIIVSKDEAPEVHENVVVKWFKKHFSIYPNYEESKFFVKRIVNFKQTLVPTVLFVVLIMIETTDIIFAVDSIPAAFGVSRDPFILYSSNVMAILGLRALYFVLLSVMEKFWLLKYGIGLVLSFIGLKMLISPHFFEISSNFSLFVTLGILTLSILMSLVIKQKEPVLS